MTRRGGWLLGLGFAVVHLVAAAGHAGILDASWTAPTMNTDGSPLTDLASYRVYYETSSLPCPGPTFVPVASTTPSPPPDLSVLSRLGGLAAGTLYTVAVTALDSAGNESPCSTFASAVARIEFGVSPTGAVSFGSVNVGSVADQTLTVQNTVGGTVAGTVTTSAPFSVVSGSPFSLVGQGATQAVTLRFTPTTAAAVRSNVSVAANGDTLSRLLIGTGVLLDITPPTVAITSPTPEPVYSTTDPTLTLGGTALDDVGVTLVTWESSRGATGTATGTTSWAAGGIALQLGPNVVTVTARDAAGNVATDTVTVALRGTFTYTDDPITPESTVVRAAHIMELRAAIDSLRVAYGLLSFGWTDATLTPGETPVRLIHLIELRTALNQAYDAAGRPLPTYTDAGAATQVTIIRAAHLSEIRAAVLAL